MDRMAAGFSPQIVSQMTRLKGQSVELLFHCACESLLKDRVFDLHDNISSSNNSGSTGADGLWPRGHHHQLAQLTVPEQDLPRVFALACAIATLLAKENCSWDQTRESLVQLGFSQEITDQVLLPLFKDQLPRIRWILNKSKLDFAEIVDVSWRLDLVVRSKSQGIVHEPMYLVNFVVQQPHGDLTDLPMTCSLDELRELVYKLQELHQQIDRLEQTNSEPSSNLNVTSTGISTAASAAPPPSSSMMRLHSMP